MAVIRSDSLEFRAPLPGDERAYVGIANGLYATKEDIPLPYRFIGMEVKEAGVWYTLVGGTADTDWVEVASGIDPQEGTNITIDKTDPKNPVFNVPDMSYDESSVVANIATNASNIASNDTDIATNATAIASLNKETPATISLLFIEVN